MFSLSIIKGMSLPSPSMSFSPFAILTAEEMNDLVENIEALSDGSGLADGAVTPAKLATGAAAAYTATAGTTTSTSYTATLTSGGTNPSVTATIGANGLALVSIYAGMSGSNATNRPTMSFAMSGANTHTPSGAGGDIYSLRTEVPSGTVTQRYGATFLLAGLTPGSTTFTLQYATNANTATFTDRRIAVVPL